MNLANLADTIATVRQPHEAIIYDPPIRIGNLVADVYEGDMPTDVALWDAARIGAAEQLRRIADAAEAEGSFAVALSKLRKEANRLDPEGAQR